jgi:aspartyl/asparaginyl beta-hydroxylase (cupin superfamily)
MTASGLTPVPYASQVFMTIQTIPTEEDADRLLEQAPRDIAALVSKGDFRMAAGDDRTAVVFYRAALKQAAAGPLPLALKPWLERAQQAIARSSLTFEQHLEQSLATAGFPAGARPPRFQHSIDILTGRRQAQGQLQQPKGYLYPGLSQRRYFEREEFAWSAEVERATGTIRTELTAMLQDGQDRFTPYLVNDPKRRPQDVHGLIDNPDWSTLYLWQDGRAVEDHVRHFPKTFATMMDSGIDLPHITTRAPCIMFSRLLPGAHIPPHTGMLNARLICHLPLIVPAGCGFRVGGELREWKEGELLVFDDTVEHEAWNHGDSQRFLLIFDTWHPELDADERRAVTALFEAVDAYSR